MHEKNIKRLAVKQLKKEVPNWRRIPRKQKKVIANKILEEVMNKYSFKENVDIPTSELTGTHAISEDIMTLSHYEKIQ